MSRPSWPGYSQALMRKSAPDRRDRQVALALQEGRPVPDPYGLGSSFSMGTPSEKGDGKSVPAVAIILIGLGVLFLLHTMNIFEFGLDRFWPLILIFFGGWILAKQWGVIGSRRYGCQCDRCRMRRTIGPSVLITIGVLFLLQSLNVVDFDRTWPAILLVIGIVKLLQSNASEAGHTGLPPLMRVPYTPPQAPPPTSTPASGTSSSGEVRDV